MSPRKKKTPTSQKKIASTKKKTKSKKKPSTPRKKTAPKKKTPTRKKNNLLRGILVESMSEDHLRIIEKLYEPRYDEDIAEELDLKATIVRTLLNELHSNSLVGYERSKNKKTGWYTYLWNRREDKIKDYIKEYLQHKLVNLKTKLNEENNIISFNCSCMRVPFDLALEYEFICPECEKKYTEYNNTKDIRILDRGIKEVNTLLDKITESELF